MLPARVAPAGRAPARTEVVLVPLVHMPVVLVVVTIVVVDVPLIIEKPRAVGAVMVIVQIRSGRPPASQGPGLAAVLLYTELMAVIINQHITRNGLMISRVMLRKILLDLSKPVEVTEQLHAREIAAAGSQI